MTAIATGQTQRIKKLHRRWPGNVVPCSVTSAMAWSARQIQPTKTAVRNPPIGRANSFQTVAIMVRKSVPRPGSVPRASTAPLPSAEGIAIRKTPVVTSSTALRLGHLWTSMKCATGTSSNEMVEVSAAMVRRTKKAAPNSCPPGRVANRRGSTVKIRPGPLELGSNPSIEKPDGKMMKPASNAIEVSSSTTQQAAEMMLSRFWR